MKRERTTMGGRMKAGLAGAAVRWARLSVWGLLLSASLLWSCSNSSSGSLTAPVGIAVDAGSNNYVADSGNNRIVRMSGFFGGNWTTFGSMGSGTDQFSNPLGVAVDSNGKIYIADSGNNRIVRIDNMNGDGWITLGGPAPGSGVKQFNTPFNIAVDATATPKIYVTDLVNNRIVQMTDMTGANWTTYSGPALDMLDGPYGIAVDINKEIYVTDYGNNRIVQMDDMLGTGWTTLGGPTPGSGAKQFNTPYSIAVDATATPKIYVADTGNDRIVQMDDIMGNNWLPLGSAGTGRFHFNVPAGITVDSFFNIYVSDQNNNRIVAMTNIIGLNWTSYP